jgi:hypothetical protein
LLFHHTTSNVAANDPTDQANDPTDDSAHSPSLPVRINDQHPLVHAPFIALSRPLITKTPQQ